MKLDSHAHALDLAAAMLTTGRGSRLAQRLRDPGLVSSVGASHYGVIDAGVFSIGAELDAARLPQVLDIIGGEVRSMAERVPDLDEVERARTLIRMRIRRRLERFESRAIALADAESLGDITRLDREEAEFDAVTPERIRDVVAERLVGDGVSAVVYEPRRVIPAEMIVIPGEMPVIPGAAGDLQAQLGDAFDSSRRAPWRSPPSAGMTEKAPQTRRRGRGPRRRDRNK